VGTESTERRKGRFFTADRVSENHVKQMLCRSGKVAWQIGVAFLILMPDNLKAFPETRRFRAMILKATSGLSSPTIDVGEARWAADQLAGLVEQVGEDSITGLVLQQAYRELESLVRSVDPQGATVLGPIRLRHVA
jgi:hypothetical protein